MNYLYELKRSLEYQVGVIKDASEEEKDPILKAKLEGKVEGLRIAMGSIYGYSRLEEDDR